MQTRLKLEAQSTSTLSNLWTVITAKSQELALGIIGDYNYRSKNSFSYGQKQKILSYLQAKVLTQNAQLQEQQKSKFVDFDEHLLDSLPSDIEALRSRLIKARTNLEAAHQTLEKEEQLRKTVTARYLNEQALEFDRTKYQSMAWGFFFGALINTTLYKRGNPIRKFALFLACGHLMGIAGYLSHLDRYFDAVYPVFEKDAAQFAHT